MFWSKKAVEKRRLKRKEKEKVRIVTKKEKVAQKQEVKLEKVRAETVLSKEKLELKQLKRTDIVKSGSLAAFFKILHTVTSKENITLLMKKSPWLLLILLILLLIILWFNPELLQLILDSNGE